MQLDEALTSRDSINLNLRQILDDATDKWGVRVVRVEIQRIDPPPDVMHAMHEQMKAERTRRAVVTAGRGRPHRGHHHGPRASGRPRSSPPRASKQQQILEAEGEAEAIRADRRRRALPPGDRRRRARPNAIRTVYEAIHEGEPDARPARHQVPRGARR